MSYRAPVRSLLAVMSASPAFDQGLGLADGLDRDTVAAILEAAGRFAEDTLAPLNSVGDRHGCNLTPDGVTTAPGFAKAYRAFSLGGWNSLSADPAYGGQGLPKILEMAVFEIFQGANMAFSLCPMLTQGTIEALAKHGDARQKALYLPPLVSGEWTGAMALTEAQAGTDLAALTTRAEPDGRGGYRLYGQKIFITWGDHDCADNIVHLVLARLPGAPEGVKGISLFLASKHHVGSDGSLGERNNFRAIGLEDKLGIHGSPTCVIQYEGARAERIGEAHEGLAQMFTMMNAARLHVGVQGVGIAERAFQQALAYTGERRQGKSAFTGQANAVLFDHPDVRRQLLLMKAKIAGGRAMCLAAAAASDLSRMGADADIRESARLREEFLTPIVKAWCTDMAVQVASDALQLHGGAGYIEETGAAQCYRDARIGPIYEGVNAIQAVDLAFRKLPMADSRAWREHLGELSRTGADLIARSESSLQRLGQSLAQAQNYALKSADWLLAQGRTPGALAGAGAFLTQVGDLLAAEALGKQALVSSLGVAMADVFSNSVLSGAAGLTTAAMQGARSIETLTPQDLS